MTTADIIVDRPWQQLEEVLATGDPQQLRQYIEQMPEGESARALAHLSSDDQQRVLELLDPEHAAWLIDSLPTAQAADIIGHLPPDSVARIVAHLKSDYRADLLNTIEDKAADAILEEMPPEVAADTRELAAYDPDTAGGLMVTEVVAFRSDLTVGDIVRQMRQHTELYADVQVQYVFVINAQNQLIGVLRLRDLLFQPDDCPVTSIMIREPLTVSADMHLDDLAAIFDARAFLGIPVVDAEGGLLGLVHRSAVEEAMSNRADSDHLKSQGIIGGEELRSFPVSLRSRRRLSWLSVNIVLNIIAATVIALYQGTLEQVIALAVFLPIISDMSGCSGNQAVAVTMRELTLNLIKPVDALWVWGKEVIVGIINGIVLGILIGAVAFFWKGNPWLGGVVGVALALNTVVAVSIGGVVPLLLKKFDMDPALASGPILTTVTDMCGFFLTLSFASAVLPYLVES